jgi:hypothetical protein
MIPALREAFNRNFRPETYRTLMDSLEADCGTPIDFRVSETPCFVRKELLDRMSEYGRELITQLVYDPAYRRSSDATVPPQYNVPDESSLPMFVQVDFGLVRSKNGELEPKLVELQAFPSLYGYQPLLANRYIEVFDLPRSLGVYLDNHNSASYRELMREAILGGHNPENVILLEVHPEQQKTLCDFRAEERELGIAIVDILQLKKRGDRLFYEKAGREIPVRRIYNRCIVEELDRKGIRLPFDLTQPLEVEWAGHPNWYFRISKFSIPYLNHKCVPKTWFLDQRSTLPQDPENYLLKPLYSFAGTGIRFHPKQEDIDRIPMDQRHNYILQERLHFEPVIQTPYGLTQMEIRIMYVWPEGGALTAAIPLVRMGRGMMMGVDHNRNMEWVGGSAALWV